MAMTVKNLQFVPQEPCLIPVAACFDTARLYKKFVSLERFQCFQWDLA